MRRNIAEEITKKEWKEIQLLPEIMNRFQSEMMTVDDLAGIFYGAKFRLSDEMDNETIVYTLVFPGRSRVVAVHLLRDLNGLRVTSK